MPFAWRCLEAWFQRRYDIRPLTHESDCLLSYNLGSYQGPEIQLSCGSRLSPGDLFVELHFRREALLPLIQCGNAARMGVGLVKLGDRDIPQLARLLHSDPRLADVKAAHALTLFHRGIQRWGFDVMPMEGGLAEWWFTAWHRLLMARDHPGGRRHVREHAAKLTTRHVWVSRETLLRRYV